MLARVHGAVLDGVVARDTVIEIEFDRRWAAPRWTGWVQRAARECLVRVQSALRRCGFDIPPHCIMMGAVPGDPPVRSAALDLPVAIGLLVATGNLPPEATDATWFAGELTLAGSVLPIRGALPMALAARAAGAKTLILSARNAREVVPWVDGIDVLGAQTLGDVLLHLLGQQLLSAVAAPVAAGRTAPEDDILPGPPETRRALEVAAAGGHHLLLVGPPGSGKTLLASRLARLLPPPTFEEARETAIVWSAVGLLDPDRQDATSRSFRAPHHTVSFAGLLGGGNPTRPGEASLAHHGVLFLDELPEFNAGALGIVRHAALTGEASICRSDGTVRMPARFQLVAAANPCPCGHHGDPSRACKCRQAAIDRHNARIRFPLGDVFDIRVRLPKATYESTGDSPSSMSAVKARVAAARALQAQRARDLGLSAVVNAGLTDDEVRRLLPSRSQADEFIERLTERAAAQPGLALRAARVARTLADLDASSAVATRHVAEALDLADPDGPWPGKPLLDNEEK